MYVLCFHECNIVIVVVLEVVKVSSVQSTLVITGLGTCYHVVLSYYMCGDKFQRPIGMDLTCLPCTVEIRYSSTVKPYIHTYT